MTKSIPPTVWAQRKDVVYISFDVQDVKEPKINLDAQKLTFSGKSGSKVYEVELNLLKEIDPAKSKYVVRPRRVEFVLQKKQPGPFWERLLSEKVKYNWLKVDWGKWKDEDEQDEDLGVDMGEMNNFNFDDGGVPESDSDDEEIPDLEGKKTEEEEEKKEENKEENKEEKKE